MVPYNCWGFETTPQKEYDLFLVSRNQEYFVSRVQWGDGGATKVMLIQNIWFVVYERGSISSPKIVLVAWWWTGAQVIMRAAGCCLVLKIWSLAAYWLSLMHARLRRAFKIVFGKRGCFSL